MMKRWLGMALAAPIAIAQAAPASAYLFWVQPTFAGGIVSGDEPGLGLAMPKATPAELRAHMLWNMRAGLNVAALQCQFSPILMTVSNYNDLLSKNADEMNTAYKSLTAYFKRTSPKTWQKALDSYTTKTYNGFSTMHAQLGFCETASVIGKDARKLGRGKFNDLAMNRIRELRNSLVPVGDAIRTHRFVHVPIRPWPMTAGCWDKKGVLRDSCSGMIRVVADASDGSRPAG